MARHIEIEIVNAHCVYVRGYGSRDALASVMNRPPLWSSRAKAWTCAEHTARELLLPHLEHLGVNVVITGPRASRSLLDVDHPDIERGLPTAKTSSCDDEVLTGFFGAGDLP